ncbi:MAG: hypothetical protein DCF32_09075 [Leptolyngbya sp.]|nr:MAG: hypothetical protein DCF32_09075 [Leptolyngbya sp.]
MNTQFLEAVFADGILHPNFFNGRILTATDLRDEQAANLKRSRYLGQALGTGVVHGLTVTATNGRTALAIAGGLAINPRGEALPLPGTVTTLNLVLANRPTGTVSSPFVPCDLPAAATLTGVVSTGFYLLAITSVTRLSTKMAPNSGLNGDQPGCTNRYEEIGVQFKLVPLTNVEFVTSPAPGLNNRSRLAHLCFGTNQRIGFARDPVHAPVQYGLVARLRESGRLTDCDVPLALFHYQAQTVQFVDLWAVRRPCLQTGQDQAWGQPAQPLVGQRQAIEAQALLLQFQQHLEDLRPQPGTTIRAIDHFEYLPPAGYLPAGRAGLAGFNLATFFAGASLQQISLDPAQIRHLLQRSFDYLPINLSQDAVDVYPVVTAAGQEPYVLFMRRGLSQFLPTASGNCTYTLTPSNWEASLTQIANGANDIHICLQAGNYTLTRPIEIKNKGHIKITGAGLGTRLFSSNAEAALWIENCQSVVVRDLYAQNGSAKSPQSKEHLQGTLSAYNCQEVTVENVSLRCVTNSEKTAACITVSPLQIGPGNLSTTESTVRIQNCNLEPGDRQIGLLLINPRYAQVDNNRIVAFQSGNPAFQGIVVAGTIAKDVRILNNTIENARQGVHIGVSQQESSRGSPLYIDNLLVLGNTIQVALPNQSRRSTGQRHGIFVGNCRSMVIENNYLTLKRFTSTRDAVAYGIDIYGFLGPRVVVRQNHLTSLDNLPGFTESIRLNELPGTTGASPLIENNFIAP